MRNWRLNDERGGGDNLETLRDQAQKAVRSLRARIGHLDADSIDLILRDARSHYAWTDKPVTEDTLRIRFGQFTIFMPLLLKPAPTRLRLVLWSLTNGLSEFPESPPPDRASALRQTTQRA